MSKKDPLFNVENYGELLALAYDLALIHYKEEDNYSGRYVAILCSEDRIFIFSDYFGSCSGCDFLQDVETSIGKVKYSDIKQYAEDVKPLYILPLDKNNKMLVEALKSMDQIIREGLA